MAGKSCGVSPTAMASAKSADSRSGRLSAALMTKMDTVRATVTLNEQNRKTAQADLEAGLFVRLAKADRDVAEGAASSRLHYNSAAGARAHYGAHEHARRQIEG